MKNKHDPNNLFRACADLMSFDSARQSKIDAKQPNEEDHSQKEKADEEDRFGKVATSQNSLNLPADGISIVSKKTKIITSKEHLILLDKPQGETSFALVKALRKASFIQKIGHTGTLDPFATGVMVLLVGKNYTRLSSLFLNQDKEYLATVHLGIATDTFDCEGKIIRQENRVPSIKDIEETLKQFQGTLWQLPPMFSAKKQGGKKLYELARKGIEVERDKVQITLSTELISYEYPKLTLKIHCSKGTYIRSIAHDIGEILQTGGHLSALIRTQSGPFQLADCLSLDQALSLYPRPCKLHIA